jgi:putative ABC transport system permease protein
MYVREALIIALRSMGAARLRTALTMLSIITGVTAVIVLVGLGNGMKTSFNESMGDLAAGITIAKSTGEVPGGNGARNLNDDDMEALAKAPDVTDITPLLSGVGVLHNGSDTYSATLVGTDSGWLRIRNREVEYGRFFTDEEYRSRAKVVVLAPRAVTYLFAGDPAAAVGAEVKVDRANYKVVGVLRAAGDQDNYAVMPLTTARYSVFGVGPGGNNLNGLGVMALSADRVPAAVDEIHAILDKQHNIKSPGYRDYSVAALINQMEDTDQYLTLLTWFAVGVAGISLFVGALGVANIMLVTVTERTSEIGIRKAIGARSAAIMKQFLIESITMAGFGGLGGVVLGVALVLVGRHLVPEYSSQFGPPELSVVGILTAFGVSLVIGLLAGCYPAFRASRLHPIEALRY